MIATYKARGEIKKGLKVGPSIKAIELKIIDKINNDVKLTNDEEYYMTNCNKYIVLKKRKDVHKDIYLSLLRLTTTRNAIAVS